MTNLCVSMYIIKPGLQPPIFSIFALSCNVYSTTFEVFFLLGSEL